MNSGPSAFRFPVLGPGLMLATVVFSSPLQARTREPEDPQLIWTLNNVVLVSKQPGVFAVVPDDAAAKNVEGIPARDKLLALLPREAVVVPGHGRPTGVAAIEYPIGYLPG